MCETRVICPICLKSFKQITNTHLNSHNLTLEEFKRMYPNHSMICEETRRTKDTSDYIDYSIASKNIHKTKYRQEYEKYLKNLRQCKQCGATIPFEKRNNMFCCQICANTYTSQHMTQSTRDKIGESVKQWHIDNPEKSAELRSNHINTACFSSKGERELRSILQNKFPELNFTTGGCWKVADNMYKSVDIYSRQIQLIIEYDGIYHFQDIYGNLPEVQLKDKLLEQWCAEHDWKIIRVNETTYYTHKEQIVSLLCNYINDVETLDTVTKLYWEVCK